MSKYEISDNHEWADEKEAQKQQQEWEDRASLSDHSITVVYDETQEYQSAEKYTVNISHSSDVPKALHVVTYRNKGTYWREKDVSDWIDFQDMPMPARKCVADTLDMSVEELTDDRRLMGKIND